MGIDALSRLVCGSSAGSVAEAEAAMLMRRAVAVRAPWATPFQGDAAGRSMARAVRGRLARLDAGRSTTHQVVLYLVDMDPAGALASFELDRP